MRLFQLTSFLLMAVFLTACPIINGYKYNQGSLPENPVNLEAFNTEYDDYNSTAPSLGRLVPFCYSTNRHSRGGEFNILYEPMKVEFDKTSGDLTVLNEYGSWNSRAEEFVVLRDAVFKANSTGNELGPNLLYDHYSELSGWFEFVDVDFALLYASDEGGDYDISYTYNLDGSHFSESRAVSFLNSEADDMYPCFDSDYTRMYFCSDRDKEDFDIYYVEVDYANDSLLPVLDHTEDLDIVKEAVLSGVYDDKCPFIFEDIMVFTSNRPGGYGGFDLYYSRWEDGAWSDPVNFGPSINSDQDDYRPILFEEEVDYTRYMMVFSSNRPGGKGGFDLYFVGILE